MGYVSRAENKLESAARAFRYDFRGKTVLDIGSSTGGFTEYALSCGAAKVIAVEKGTNQMKAPLKFDPRIDLHEKTDIFHLTGEEEYMERPDTILADVSFVSLKSVLSHAKNYLAGENTDYLVMLKPQFEAKSNQLVKGVVKNEKMRREIVRDFEIWLKNHGFLVLKKQDNELLGKNGNKERFYWLKTARIS